MGPDLQKYQSRNKLASNWNRKELPERNFRETTSLELSVQIRNGY